MVHDIPDKLSGGAFGAALGEWFVPSKEYTWKKTLTGLLLNKTEDWTYFAPVAWNSACNLVLWTSILYLRSSAKENGDSYSNMATCLFLFVYLMGICHTNMGGNEVILWQTAHSPKRIILLACAYPQIHYTAHLQVSPRTEAHLFKYEILNQAVRWLLEPAMGWLPGFWLDHHVLIHHKESNGVDDIQSVSFYERCPKNFIWFVAEMPLQWYFRAPRYHLQKGEVGTAMTMIATSTLYVVSGVSLLRWDPIAGCLWLVPHMHRLFTANATNEYCQHALVDPRGNEPEAPSRNSFLLLQPFPTAQFPAGLRKRSENWEDQWHAVHHNFPRRHMSDLQAKRSTITCHLVFDMSYKDFRPAVIQQDVKALAAAWRPGYKFVDASDATKETEVAHEDAVRVAKGKAKAATEDDEEMDQATKEKIVASFFKPAMTQEDCKSWATAPSFPFCFMQGVGRDESKVKAKAA